MKLTLTAVSCAVLLISGQSMAANAPAPKEAANCMMCHDIEKTKMGPAFKDISAKYAGQKTAQAQLAERILKGTGAGVGWMKAGKASMPSMPPNAIKAEDAEKLAKWVLSLK